MNKMKGVERQLSEESTSSIITRGEEQQDDERYDNESQDEHHFQIVLQHLPNHIVHKARELLHMMANSQNILFWDSKGQLKYHKRTIPGTNLGELIEYVLLPEEEDIEKPNGLASIMKGLAELRVNKTLIKNHNALGQIIAMEKQLDGHTDPRVHEESDHTDENMSDLEDDHEETDTEEEPADDVCQNCDSDDVDKTTLSQCPDCHWVDNHEQLKDSLECNACGSQQSKTAFSKTHSIRHCNDCKHTDVKEHEEDSETESDDNHDNDNESDDESQ